MGRRLDLDDLRGLFQPMIYIIKDLSVSKNILRREGEIKISSL